MDHEHEPQSTLRMGFEGKAAQAQASLGDDLWEMHSAGSKIAEYTAGRHFEDFHASDVLRAVVASMLTVMADALERMSRQAPEQAARLAAPDLLALAGRLRKEEAAVPQVEVWSFVENALPELLTRVTTELEAWHQG